jgi:hypothetical protein
LVRGNGTSRVIFLAILHARIEHGRTGGRCMGMVVIDGEAAIVPARVEKLNTACSYAR